MPTLAEIVRTHRADYQAQHSLSLLERQTLDALLACRSGSLGSTEDRQGLDGQEEVVVVFSYRDKKTGASRHVRLKATEFIRRFLDHLLPSGFQKVRHYGFFSPTWRVRWRRSQWRL